MESFKKFQGTETGNENRKISFYDRPVHILFSGEVSPEIMEEYMQELKEEQPKIIDELIWVQNKEDMSGAQVWGNAANSGCGKEYFNGRKWVSPDI